MFDELTNWSNLHVSLGGETQRKLLLSIALAVFLWLARLLLLRIVHRRSNDPLVHYQWKKVSAYFAVVIGIIVVGRVWIEGFESLATFLGLLSAGLAIALKDLVTNLAAWAFILWRRPFEVGDRIQIGSVAGDVIDLRIFQFTLMEIGNWVDADQSTGRVIHIPNGRVFSEPLANFTKGFEFLWNELPVLLTFESDWQKAKELLQSIAEKHSIHLTSKAAENVSRVARKYMIFYSKLTPIVYTKVEASGVLLTVRYLCEPRRRRGSAEAIWEDVLHAFAEHQTIDFAYPTLRYFDHSQEGKGMKPSPRPGSDV